MNSQQAINLLNGLEQRLDDYCELNNEGKAAFRMAITALELFGNAERLKRCLYSRKTEKKKMRHIMGNTPRCDECYWYTAKNENDKDNWSDGWCRQEKEVKDWNQRDRMKTRANDRCRFWEDAEDRLTYYEVETRSPEAWRSDIEKCIIEKMLKEDKQ